MARRSVFTDLMATLLSYSARFRRTPNPGLTSAGLFVCGCMVISVVVMIYSSEGHVQAYFKRHSISQRDIDGSKWSFIPSEPDSDDLDPDLEEDVPAAYKAFVFAPERTETEEMDWWERQVSRKEHIRRTCDRVLGNFEADSSDGTENVSSSGPSPERLLKDMSLDPDDDIMFCPSLLDVGQKSSRWDSLLAHAGSEALRVVVTENVRGISEVDSHLRPKPAIAQSSPVKEPKPQDMSWLKRFTKILFVEHPFEKIISLYRNRLHGRRGYLGQEMGKRALIYNRGLKNLTDRDLQMESPTFREMTSFIVHRDFIDPHVKSTYEVCNPCEFDYDYVIKTETFAEDIRNVFKQVFPAPKWRKMFDKFPSFKELDEERVEKTMLKYYKDVPEDDLLMLYDLYSIDMFMFNYQWPFDKLRLRRMHKQ